MSTLGGIGAVGLRTLFYRPLQPEDFAAVKAAHAALFPIDYDDGFFHKATNSLDRIWSCAAFTIGAFGEQQLAGFITAKIVRLHECDISDRQHMGLLSPVIDHDAVLYILTLGVLQTFRQQGVASHLISCVCQHAFDTHCRAVFLHVISYNTAAMSLYGRAGFSCVARLPAFYHIATGRQPDPATPVYDAFLYVLFTAPGGGQASSWDLLTIAWSPLRSALGRIQSCVPQFCRQQYPASSTATCRGSASSAGVAAAGGAAARRSNSCNSVNSYPQQLQQQQQLDLQEQQQQEQQHQLLLPPYSRYRHRQRPHSPSADGKQQQQQCSLLLPPVVPIAAHSRMQQYQQQCQQQQQHMQQDRRVQQQHRQQQQQQHWTPPQRVLQWLFNGSSRAPSDAFATSHAAPGGQQQRREGGCEQR